MKAEEMNRNNKDKRSSLLIVLAIIVCIGLIGLSFARYITNEKHKESANLADFNIQIIDMQTMAPLDWDIEIPATTRLYDDVHFNDTVIVKRLRITNESNRTVKISAALKDKILADYHNNEDTTDGSEDILIFAFNYDVYDKFQTQIQAALDENLDENSSASDIKANALSVSSENLAKWTDDSDDFDPGESKYLTILVWRENAAVNNENSFGKTVYLKEHLELDVLQK